MTTSDHACAYGPENYSGVAMKIGGPSPRVREASYSTRYQQKDTEEHTIWNWIKSWGGTIWLWSRPERATIFWNFCPSGGGIEKLLENRKILENCRNLFRPTGIDEEPEPDDEQIPRMQNNLDDGVGIGNLVGGTTWGVSATRNRSTCEPWKTWVSSALLQANSLADNLGRTCGPSPPSLRAAVLPKTTWRTQRPIRRAEPKNSCRELWEYTSGAGKGDLGGGTQLEPRDGSTSRCKEARQKQPRVSEARLCSTGVSGSPTRL